MTTFNCAKFLIGCERGPRRFLPRAKLALPRSFPLARALPIATRQGLSCAPPSETVWLFINIAKACRPYRNKGSNHEAPVIVPLDLLQSARAGLHITTFSR